MQTFKTILAVIVVMLGVTGIILCGVGIWYSWSLNTPLTEGLTETLTTAESILTRADEGVERINSGIGVARQATSTIQGAVLAAGDTIVNTDIAFTVLERTVGDTLFPVIVEAAESSRAIAGTIIGINDALESANRLPFVEVPTLSDELNVVAAELTAARERVDEIRGEIQTAKETAVGRPVSAVTSRTEPLLERLDVAQATLREVNSRIDRTLAGLGLLRGRLPGLLDALSVVLTLVFLWLILAQGALTWQGWSYLRGRSV